VLGRKSPCRLSARRRISNDKSASVRLWHPNPHLAEKRANRTTTVDINMSVKYNCAGEAS